MNKLQTIAIFILLLLFVAPLAEAQVPARQQALNHMLKTNRLIGVAHMAVKRGKVYTGNLGKAVRNQRYAKKLFTNGNYLKAIQYSRRARLFAVEAIKANKVKPTSDATLSPEEEKLAGTMPSDQAMDEEMAKENVAGVKEEDLINSNNLDIDVK
ncbi:MAG: hypothetical protein K2X86_02560 [Cytophagaceae bacterium]|nr:hypothetical protein [Cytophagaceae bacterium]